MFMNSQKYARGAQREKTRQTSKGQSIKGLTNMNFYLNGDQCDLKSKKDMAIFTFQETEKTLGIPGGYKTAVTVLEPKITDSCEPSCGC